MARHNRFGYGVSVSWSARKNKHVVTWRGSVKLETGDRKEAYDYAASLLPASAGE